MTALNNVPLYTAGKEPKKNIKKKQYETRKWNRTKQQKTRVINDREQLSYVGCVDEKVAREVVTCDALFTVGKHSRFSVGARLKTALV